MSQAILISDNETINSLYELNLRAYVATNVTVRESLKEAKELLEHSLNIDAVICFRELDQKDNAIEDFLTYLEERNRSIPMIVLGEPNTPIRKSIIIPNKYDIKSLLKSMAKILEISASQMASRAVPTYFPIPLKLLIEMKSSHCDIYYRAEKDDFSYDYFKILERDTPIGDSFQNYINEGAAHLYIDADERLRFINKASTLIVGELERDDLTTAEKVEITQQGMGMVAEDVFESEEITQEIADISKACMRSINTVLKDVPKMKNLLSMLLENTSGYCYMHSVLSTYIARELIANMSWGNKEQQNKVSFAFFFHDIYLVPLYKKYPFIKDEEDFLFNDKVEVKDKKIVLEHAAMAGELVKSFPRCPLGADMIVQQHHGMTSGEGFAVQFKDDISPLAKVMIIAEYACNLITERVESGEKIFKDEIADLLEEKFKNHTYRKIIAAFRESKF